MKFEPLSKKDAEIYNVVKDLLKNHKQFNLGLLLPECFTALNGKYSEAEISQSIQSLIQKRYFIKGTSLTRDDILENQVRKRILNYIQVNPGAYNRLIRRELNLGSNEFNWHMGMLLKFAFVKKLPFTDRSYGYFENRSYMGHEKDLFLYQNEKVQGILKQIETQPESSTSMVAKNLDMHYSTVQKYLRILAKREILIEKTKDGQTSYIINQDMKQKLQKIINGQVFIEFAMDSDFDSDL